MIDNCVFQKGTKRNQKASRGKRIIVIELKKMLKQTNTHTLIIWFIIKI